MMEHIKERIEKLEAEQKELNAADDTLIKYFGVLCTGPMCRLLRGLSGRKYQEVATLQRGED